MNDTSTLGKGAISQAEARLCAECDRLVHTLLHGPPPQEEAASFRALHSDLVDAYFQNRLKEISDSGASLPDPDSFAVVAVGGYGRQELCLHSDIDILIVGENAIPAEALDLAQPLFMPLWDRGYDLGHGFRTVEDCLQLAAQDPEVTTSLLDLRYITGSRRVFEVLRESLQTKVFEKRRAKLVQELIRRRDAAFERFGEASALIEPNLKQGIGGLRDYHTVLWIARLAPQIAGRLAGGRATLGELTELGCFSAEEGEALTEAVTFLFQVRNRLHSVSGRKNDVLFLDLQPRTSELLGFTAAEEISAVERFLGRLHWAMQEIKNIVDDFIHEFRGVSPETSNSSEPVIGMESFLVPNAQTGATEGEEDARASARSVLQGFHAAALQSKPVRFSRPVRRIVRKSLPAIRAEQGRTQIEVELFLEILTSGRAYPTLKAMLETGFLGAWLPEFGNIQDRVQFDDFHTYPVGRHTIEAVRVLESLQYEEQSPYSEMWESIEPYWETLLLGAFFHDIGKSGPEHEERGAKITARILTTWGLEHETVRMAVFLVRHHLLAVLTALRRDLNDETEVIQFAGKVGTEAGLKMLFLLTYADSKATGPKAWNDWSAGLLSELYFKTLNVLRFGDFSPSQSVRKLLKTRDAVREKAGRDLEPTMVEEYLESMPSRYILGVSAEGIVEHMASVRELEKVMAEESIRLSSQWAERGASVLVAKAKSEGIWEVTIAAKQQQGFFSAAAGVLTLHTLNIYSADIYVWRGGITVAVFRVSEPPDPLYADEFWGRVRSSLKFALTGKLALEYRLAGKRTSLLAEKAGTGLPPEVTVDNKVTDFYTLIEVRARDRIGLLYDIAHTLEMLQLEVHVVKADTHGERITDVFYVRDVFGGKVEDEDRVREISEALLHRLSDTSF